MKRVGAYCRVSTDKDDQINSLENQKKYFKEYIDNNPDWEFTRLYVDEGISGTSVNNRKGFKEMITDAEEKRFDLLITKEISRFARNTLDSIYYTRKLKACGIGVIFLNDNINTLDPDSELRMTIMASIAQEESRKISERVKWGQKRSMERGVVFGSRVYGYDIIGGKLHVNPIQAEVVRLIFNMYLNEGMGAYSLARELEKRGVLTPTGLNTWSSASIMKILKNEKYAGILKQRKQITTDFLTHSRKRNPDEEGLIIKEGNHEAIIEKSVFEAAQKEISRRNQYNVERSKYSNRYIWSGKIKCGYCGSKMKRRVWHKGKGYETEVWQCSSNIKYGKETRNSNGEIIGCNSGAIHDSVLKNTFVCALSDAIKDKDKIISELEAIIGKSFREKTKDGSAKEIKRQILKISNKKSRLIDLYSDKLISALEFKEKNEEYNSRINCLKIKSAELAKEHSDDKKQVLADIKEAIRSICSFNNFDEAVCRELLENVIIRGKYDFRFIFKGNVEKHKKIDEETYAALSKMQYLQQKEQSR